ncbi:MAG: hypothetical protein FJ098_06835 [Deltaproteobacteria bacterium]|nr:hypothetical protein [Deltaproteobacteria bacterium]
MSATHLIVAFLVALDVPPSEAEEFDAGQAFSLARSAFEYQDYARTVALLEPLLLPRPRLEGAQLRKAWEYIGTSHWWLGDRERFNEEMTAWLKLDPAAALDSFFYPPEMIRDFDALKRSLVAMEVIQLPGQEGPASRQDIIHVVETTRIERPPVAAWVPFGVGQFASGRHGMGAFFLVSEALALGANIGAWGWMATHRDGTGREAAVVTMYTSFGTFAALTLWGILDARLRWKTVETRETRRSEPVPPPPSAPEPMPPEGADRWHR